MMDQFAQNYANKGIVRLREIFTPGTLQVPKTQTALKELESIHKVKSFRPPVFSSYYHL
jgi:ATP-dependent RNA helicase SUPV3L1/SUV3